MQLQIIPRPYGDRLMVGRRYIDLNRRWASVPPAEQARYLAKLGLIPQTFGEPSEPVGTAESAASVDGAKMA